MAETKDAQLNSLIREYNELAPQGRKLSDTSTFVGGVVPVGTTRKIARFSCELFTSQDSVSHPWLAVVFDDGTKISLKSLMGLPSMEGFFTEGEFPCDEFTGELSNTGEREVTVRQVRATGGEFELSTRYTPRTWCVNDFLNNEADRLVGANVTYCGTALKPYTVRRPFGAQVPGGRAVITCDLWKVEFPQVATPME